MRAAYHRPDQRFQSKSPIEVFERCCHITGGKVSFAEQQLHLRLRGEFPACHKRRGEGVVSFVLRQELLNQPQMSQQVTGVAGESGSQAVRGIPRIADGKEMPVDAAEILLPALFLEPCMAL